MEITGVSTEFTPHGMYASPSIAASKDTKGKRSNGRYDGGDTPLAGHDLTNMLPTDFGLQLLPYAYQLHVPASGAWDRLDALGALEASIALPLRD